MSETEVTISIEHVDEAVKAMTKALMELRKKGVNVSMAELSIAYFDIMKRMFSFIEQKDQKGMVT